MSILAQWLSLLARPFGLDGAARVALGASVAALGLVGLLIVALRRRGRRAAQRALQVAPPPTAALAIGTEAPPEAEAETPPKPEARPVNARTLPEVLTEVRARPVHVSGPTQPLRLQHLDAASTPPLAPPVPGAIAVAERPPAPPHEPVRESAEVRDMLPVEITLQGLDVLVPPPPERTETREPVAPDAPSERAAADAAADAQARAEHQRGLALVAGAASEPAAALHEAIACFLRAQAVWTREAAPERWAALQNDIGHAYQEMLEGDRAAHLRTAIEHHEAALEVFDPVRHAVAWAWTQSALGAAHQNLPVGSALANARAAVAYHERALDIFTQEHTPLAWAWNQNNLGAALEMMRGGAEGERVARLRQAEGCYEAALEIYTPEAYPMRHQIVARNLARVRTELRGLD